MMGSRTSEGVGVEEDQIKATEWFVQVHMCVYTYTAYVCICKRVYVRVCMCVCVLCTHEYFLITYTRAGG